MDSGEREGGEVRHSTVLDGKIMGSGHDGSRFRAGSCWEAVW